MRNIQGNISSVIYYLYLLEEATYLEQIILFINISAPIVSKFNNFSDTIFHHYGNKTLNTHFEAGINCVQFKK